MTVERALRLIAGSFILLSLALGTLRKPVLVPFHGFCWPESVSIRTHELVPDDDVSA